MGGGKWEGCGRREMGGVWEEGNGRGVGRGKWEGSGFNLKWVGVWERGKWEEEVWEE